LVDAIEVEKELVIDALRMAWFRGHPALRLIFHSHRSCQYCSARFRAALVARRLHGVPFATRRAVLDEVIDRMGFYNHRRPHSTLDCISRCHSSGARPYSCASFHEKLGIWL
jgi:transposase InsO family protein